MFDGVWWKLNMSNFGQTPSNMFDESTNHVSESLHMTFCYHVTQYIYDVWPCVTKMFDQTMFDKKAQTLFDQTKFDRVLYALH